MDSTRKLTGGLSLNLWTLRWEPPKSTEQNFWEWSHVHEVPSTIQVCKSKRVHVAFVEGKKYLSQSKAPPKLVPSLFSFWLLWQGFRLSLGLGLFLGFLIPHDGASMVHVSSTTQEKHQPLPEQ